ncbi:MAG: roadblock/LC7 domain-containing protein [Promethearchaeota archaeon]
MQFGSDVGIREEDIALLEPEIAFVTSNSDIEAIALVSNEGYQIAFAAIPEYQIDSDALSGISSALLMTSKMAMNTVFGQPLSEILVRSGDGYLCVTNAGRFVLVGAGRNIKTMMQTVKVFRVAAARISATFPDQ